SQASGHGESAKIVQALVTRSPSPFTPAAVYASGALTDLNLGTQGFELSGFDHQIDGTPAAAAPLPALAGPNADPSALPSGLSGSAAGQLSGAGATPSIASTAPLDLASMAAAGAAYPNRVWVSPTSDANLVLGTTSAPQVSIVSGNLDVS